MEEVVEVGNGGEVGEVAWMTDLGLVGKRKGVYGLREKTKMQ